MHIAAHGFDAVELFATRAHFDYHDEHAIGRLAEWLSDTRLELHSLHAPVFEGMKHGRWVGSFSNASGDEERRRVALAETRAALQVARRIPYRFLVVHLGMPSAEQLPPGDNRPTEAGAVQYHTPMHTSTPGQDVLNSGPPGILRHAQVPARTRHATPFPPV